MIKKLCSLMLIAALLPACSTLKSNPTAEELEAQEVAAYKQKVSDWKTEKAKKKAAEANMKLGDNVVISPYVKGKINKFSKDEPIRTVMEIEEEMRYKQYQDKYARLIDNVSVHDRSDTEITYEYSDARIDELAFMAVQYCREQDRKKAFLQKITLYKNRARLATFDCRSL